MSTVPQTCNWQAGFLAILPAVWTHARIQFRRLPAEKKEEAIQETLAAACTYFQLAAARGRLHSVRPRPLADFAVRHVRTGRHVGAHQDAARDIHSPVCQRRHGIRLRSYSDSEDWRQVAIADRKTSIPDTAAFRIDFARWLGTLSRRDRRIIAALGSGQSTSAVSDRFGISPGRVSQLRRTYERRWRSFQGEPAADILTSHSSECFTRSGSRLSLTGDSEQVQTSCRRQCA